MSSGKIVPQVATAWRNIDDTHIEFDLRTDVKFHDGTPLTAEDVAFSAKRITNPELKSSAAVAVRPDRRCQSGQARHRSC